LRYLFENYALRHRPPRAEARRSDDLVPPKVFDLLLYLIRSREHVVSKDDLISAIWDGRIVSDAAVTTRLNVARSAIGDSGEKQHLIQTLQRKGFRFVGAVREDDGHMGTPATSARSTSRDRRCRSREKRPLQSCLHQHERRPRQDYITDGITEDIITELSRFSELFRDRTQL